MTRIAWKFPRSGVHSLPLDNALEQLARGGIRDRDARTEQVSETNTVNASKPRRTLIDEAKALADFKELLKGRTEKQARSSFRKKYAGQASVATIDRLLNKISAH